MASFMAFAGSCTGLKMAEWTPNAERGELLNPPVTLLQSNDSVCQNWGERVGRELPNMREALGFTPACKEVWRRTPVIPVLGRWRQRFKVVFCNIASLRPALARDPVS